MPNVTIQFTGEPASGESAKNNSKSKFAKKVKMWMAGEKEQGPETGKLVGPLEEKDQMEVDLSAPYYRGDNLLLGPEKIPLRLEGRDQQIKDYMSGEDKNPVMAREHYYRSVKPAVDFFGHSGRDASTPSDPFSEEEKKRRSIEQEASIEAAAQRKARAIKKDEDE